MNQWLAGPDAGSLRRFPGLAQLMLLTNSWLNALISRRTTWLRSPKTAAAKKTRRIRFREDARCQTRKRASAAGGKVPAVSEGEMH